MRLYSSMMTAQMSISMQSSKSSDFELSRHVGKFSNGSTQLAMVLEIKEQDLVQVGT
jgi:hypothetical protein